MIVTGILSEGKIHIQSGNPFLTFCRRIVRTDDKAVAVSEPVFPDIPDIRCMTCWHRMKETRANNDYILDSHSGSNAKIAEYIALEN